ncbi:hypothetical protein B0H14DRAFT_3429452 [Mycena olivaceomarginata]|nr:hypothetical protein B0H14DRAFT_3429452 [Mycena olivaceomarginata]
MFPLLISPPFPPRLLVYPSVANSSDPPTPAGVFVYPPAFRLPVQTLARPDSSLDLPGACCTFCASPGAHKLSPFCPRLPFSTLLSLLLPPSAARLRRSPPPQMVTSSPKVSSPVDSARPLPDTFTDPACIFVTSDSRHLTPATHPAPGPPVRSRACRPSHLHPFPSSPSHPSLSRSLPSLTYSPLHLSATFDCSLPPWSRSETTMVHGRRLVSSPASAPLLRCPAHLYVAHHLPLLSRVSLTSLSL